MIETDTPHQSHIVFDRELLRESVQKVLSKSGKQINAESTWCLIRWGKIGNVLDMEMNEYHVDALLDMIMRWILMLSWIWWWDEGLVSGRLEMNETLRTLGNV